MLSKINSSFKWIHSSNLGNGIKWNLIGTILSRTINLISSVFIARLMTPEVYGKYTYIVSTLVFFSQLIGLSIAASSTRNVAYLLKKDRLKCEKYIFITIVVGLLLGLLGLFVLLFLINFFKDNSIVQDYTQMLLNITVLAIISEIIYGGISGIFSGLKLFKFDNIIIITSAILKVLFSISGFFITGVQGAIVGWVIGSILSGFIAFALLFYSLKKNDLKISGIKIKDCFQEIRLFLHYSIPNSIQAGLILFSFWLIQTIIIDNGIVGKSQLAFYNISNQWKALVFYLPSVLINMLLPFFSELHGKGDESAADTLYKNSQKIIFFISLCITIIFILFSKILISIYGVEYEQSYASLIILLVPSALCSLNALYKQFYMSQGKVWMLTLISIIGSVSMILVFLFTKGIYSLSVSFALAISLSEILIFLFFFTMNTRYYVTKK